MKNLRRVGAAVAMTAALVLTLGATSAFAANNTSGSGTSWQIPTTAMTNTVEKDGVTYKVITTWANAWATGGPDYLGVSNSCYIATQGGGTSSASSLTAIQTSSLAGIWASAANDQPNAYQWNYFYNFYANSDLGVAMGLEEADFSVTDSGWDSTTGVDGRFKYRPEVIWQSNGLSLNDASTYVGYIQNGQYYSATSGTPGSSSYTAPETSEYYIAGDESYDPYMISAYCQNPFAYVETFYGLADIVENIIADYASYTGTDTDWIGMNSLPRTTRYDESARECALNVEMAVRGSVYYVLAKIADGTVEKKKVAFLTSAPSTNSNTVTVAAYDYTENIGGGANSGYASFSPLVVDQLMTGVDQTDKNMTSVSTVGASANGTNSGATGSELWYTTSTATADELLDCDIIYIPNGNTTAATVESWLSSQAVSSDKASKIANIEICANSLAICQWSNFTAEKIPYGVYAVNFFYPELFENMELVAFWYDEVYHLKTSALATAMSYTLGVADLPSGVSLSALASTYSLSGIEAKFAEGYAYYAANKDTDETISRILSGTPLYNTGSGSKGDTLALNSFEPSDTFTEWYEAYAAEEEAAAEDEAVEEEVVEEEAAAPVEEQAAALKAQTISAAAKTTVKKGKKATIKVKGAKGTIKATVNKKGLKVTVKSGKIVVKGSKKGTYKITLKAAKTSKYAKSNTIKIKVVVK